MRLYIDEDTHDPLLVNLLRQAGHDVETPSQAGLLGKDDPDQLTYAVQQDRVFLTHNHGDFEKLHWLISSTGGHYPGILVIRKDNDPKRDLRPGGVVRAIRNLLASGVPIADACIVLNQWR